MAIIIAGRRSREQGGSKIQISNIIEEITYIDHL